MNNKFNSIVVWLLRCIAALLLLQTLFFKFSAAEESVYIFSAIGIEPWGRIGTGIMELIASVLILIPALTLFGAILSASLMTGAIFFHITKLGISVQNDGGQLFIYAVTVFICSIALIIINRNQGHKLIRTVSNLFVKKNPCTTMQFHNSIENVFTQLDEVLIELTNEEYNAPSKRLFKASVGQHVRHIIELFICLRKGYQTGIVNYDSRERNRQIETDKNTALKLLTSIRSSIILPNKDLLLEAGYNENSEGTILIGTNYYREILYNLEHTVHHMALIRIGIEEVSKIKVPQDFGVAASSIKYKRTCAQ